MDNSRVATWRHFLAASAAVIATPLVLVACGGGGGGGMTSQFQRTNLVADVAGVAMHTDPNLLNPWGLARSAQSPFWVSDNHAGVSTLYDGSGTPFPANQPLVVTVPPPMNSPLGAMAAPTGIVFANITGNFVVSEGGNSGPSFFIFATEDGTISGWNPMANATEAILAVDDSNEDAIYKGMTLASNASGNFLFVTDFHNDKVSVYDKNFTEATLSGMFNDPNIPAGFAPFGIQAFGNSIYVTYAKQDANKEDDVKGPGNGYVDIFDTNGAFVKRFASQGTLDSPWGVAVAPGDFGKFSNAVLIGNFGDGRINAFNASNGAFLGQPSDASGHPITIDGLWALVFGGGSMNNGAANTLFFTAGPDGEQHGLFGSIALIS